MLNSLLPGLNFFKGDTNKVWLGLFFLSSKPLLWDLAFQETIVQCNEIVPRLYQLFLSDKNATEEIHNHVRLFMVSSNALRDDHAANLEHMDIILKTVDLNKTILIALAWALTRFVTVRKKKLKKSNFELIGFVSKQNIDALTTLDTAKRKEYVRQCIELLAKMDRAELIKLVGTAAKGLASVALKYGYVEEAARLYATAWRPPKAYFPTELLTLLQSMPNPTPELYSTFAAVLYRTRNNNNFAKGIIEEVHRSLRKLVARLLDLTYRTQLTDKAAAEATIPSLIQIINQSIRLENLPEKLTPFFIMLAHSDSSYVQIPTVMAVRCCPSPLPSPPTQMEILC